MEVIGYLLTGITIASVLGTISAVFYGYRSKAIIDLLKESNAAYQERNVLLERKVEDDGKLIDDLNSRVAMLEKIKTPSLDELTKIVITNHADLTKSVKGLTEAIRETRK